MPLTEIPPGRLTVLHSPDWEAAYRALVKHAADSLSDIDSTYAAAFCIPQARSCAFQAMLLKVLGKRRGSRHPIRDAFHTVQALQLPRQPISAETRQRLHTELTEALEAANIAGARPVDLDIMVADQPDHPLVSAYLSALQALGHEHPFTCLQDAVFPVGFEYLFVGDFHELPTAVQRWMLRALPQSVDLYVTVDDQYTLPDSIEASVEAITPGRGWRPDERPSPDTASFPDRSTELTAILQACADSEIDAVVLTRVSDRHALEAACLLTGQPYHVPPIGSLLSTREVRALVALLDWSLEQSENGLWVLVELMGTSSRSLRERLKRNNLPTRLSKAAHLSTRVNGRDAQLVAQLDAVSSLILRAAAATNIAETFETLTNWGAVHLPGFDTSIMHSFMQSPALVERNHDSRTIRDTLYRALAEPPHNAPAFCLPSELINTQSQRFWVSIADDDTESLSQLVADLQKTSPQSITVSTCH